MGELDRTRTAYLTHLALEHEMVLKYVQAAVGRSIFQIRNTGVLGCLSLNFLYCIPLNHNFLPTLLHTSVVDPDPYVFRPPGSVIICADSGPDPSIIKLKEKP